MKIIAKDRGMGKTIHLVKRSRQTGYPIIVFSDAVKRNIKNQYGESTLVYTLSEFMSGGYKRFHSRVLIDELDLTLERYLGVGIEEATFTGDVSIEQYETIQVKTSQDFNLKR